MGLLFSSVICLSSRPRTQGRALDARWESRRQRQTDLVDLGEVVRVPLLDAAPLLRLLLECNEALHDEITNRVVGLEVEEPRSVRDEGWRLVQRFVPLLNCFAKLSSGNEASITPHKE